MSTASLRANGIKFADGSNSFSAVYNVKFPEFGAVGNGSADDTTAIAAAIAAAKAAGSSTVYLPPGSYKITSSLVFSDINGMRILGAGTRATAIIWAGSVGGNMLDIQGCRECYFGEFTLTGDVANPTTVAIKYNGDLTNTLVTTKNHFDRIMVSNYCAYGLRIGQVAYQADQTMYTQCQFLHCSTAGVSIEDSNAVLHNFYDCLFAYHNLGITAINAGTGGSFNLYGCGFSLGTGVDIQTYPGSRAYAIVGCWAEASAIFLQSSQGSKASTVNLLGCSVNGSSSAGPHIRAAAGNLAIVGGRYTATGGGTFTISVGNNNGYISHIKAEGTIFPDGNPFTGANMIYASIEKVGVQYLDVGGDSGNTYGANISAWDTAGVPVTYTSGMAGTINAAAGKAAGDLTVIAATGVAGTAGLAAGPGANTFVKAASAGANNGGGGNNGGTLYLQPGPGTGAGVAGIITLLDSTAAAQVNINPNGLTTIYPQTTNARSLGGASNFWSNIFAARHTKLSQTVAAATSTTLNPASGSHVRLTLSATAITTLTVSAGNAGEELVVEVIEDGTGTRTIPTTWVNVVFAGGTYTATTTASKRDVLRFIYDGTDAKWYETSRAMNL